MKLSFHKSNKDRVFVTHPNGVVGYRVAMLLLQDEQSKKNVRVGTTFEAVANNLVEAGAEAVSFSWEMPDTYPNALKDVTTVFVSTPNYEGWEEKYDLFLSACKNAGVKHVVQLSFYHAMKSKADTMVNFATRAPTNDPWKDVPIVKMHGFCDLKLMKSHLDYTILFPTHLMSNPLRYQAKSLKEKGEFYGSSGGMKGVNYVSPNDIAAVAVHAILKPKDHRRVGYTLTGPEAIMDLTVASLLSKHLGQPITYTNVAASTFDDDVAGLELIKASGAEETTKIITHDIEKICGRPAESFEQYLLNKKYMTPHELEAYLD